MLRPGRPARVARWVRRGGRGPFNGEIRTPRHRDPARGSALLADCARMSRLVVFSPAGPLNPVRARGGRDGQGDPLALTGLLPEPAGCVVGDHWARLAVMRGVRLHSGYDALAANALDASVESLDATTVLIRLKGDIRVMRALLGGRDDHL